MHLHFNLLLVSGLVVRVDRPLLMRLLPAKVINVVERVKRVVHCCAALHLRQFVRDTTDLRAEWICVRENVVVWNVSDGIGIRTSVDLSSLMLLFASPES